MILRHFPDINVGVKEIQLEIGLWSKIATLKITTERIQQQLNRKGLWN
jgi:hypothetical protein